MNALYLLAQATNTAAPIMTTGPSEEAPWYAKYSQMMLLVGMVVLMFFFMSKGKRGQEKKRTEMLASLKRGDRVQTIGGILGTVVEAKESEVVLKVDEGSNTKMRFTRSAIHRVVEEEKTETK